MDFLKNLLATTLNFTTGLGFYGIGLLGVAAALTFFFGWGAIPAGFIGAFIYKNYDAIVKWAKEAIA
jgi:hypothetical protein